MAKTSWFTFKGELRPKGSIPSIQASYHLNRPSGGFDIEVEGNEIRIQFVGSYESFDELYYETFEFALAFFSAGALHTGLSLDLELNEWQERPVDQKAAVGVAHPITGRIIRENKTPTMLMADPFMFGLAQGVQWAEDIGSNAFLRRAILDFNYALKHPLNDIPIYLYRAVESAQVHFGGEKQLIDALNIRSEVKQVKRLANDALGGVHGRHAAMTKDMKIHSQEDIVEAVNATREVLVRFQLHLMTERKRTAKEIGQM